MALHINLLEVYKIVAILNVIKRYLNLGKNTVRKYFKIFHFNVNIVMETLRHVFRNIKLNLTKRKGNCSSLIFAVLMWALNLDFKLINNYIYDNAESNLNKCFLKSFIFIYKLQTFCKVFPLYYTILNKNIATEET